MEEVHGPPTFRAAWAKPLAPDSIQYYTKKGAWTARPLRGHMSGWWGHMKEYDSIWGSIDASPVFPVSWVEAFRAIIQRLFLVLSLTQSLDQMPSREV